MASESLKRSVDSLQSIYAVIIALAIATALQNVFTGHSHDKILEIVNKNLPSLLAFIILIVPFYHGMNRHLDKCYIDGSEKKYYNKSGLLFDFFFFCIEASLLFVFASVIILGKEAFIVLALVLIVDIFWGIISHLINYKEISPSVFRWSIINFFAVALGYFIYVYTVGELLTMWSLFVLLCVRTVIDYATMKEFYFPD